jgi:hypothetical protein
MWVSLLLLVAFSGPGTGEDSIRQQILASERAGLDCLKSGDVATFASLIADDAIFIGRRIPG